MSKKELNGLELQGYIKARQLRQVRNLRQQFGIVPKLCIIKSTAAPDVIQTYVRMKQRYADDVLIEVEVLTLDQSSMPEAIRRANESREIQGIIIQLPIDDPSETEMLCDLISPTKDVDGLGRGALYPSATAQAIDWLLAGYNVELQDKHIAVVGNGKLVGNPLSKMWKQRGLMVTVLDEYSEDAEKVLSQSDVIVSATGVPRLITSQKVALGAVVVDAGTTSENGQIVGDVDESVRIRDDVTITPVKGGVGPLTITVLFEHVIEACFKQAGQL